MKLFVFGIVLVLFTSSTKGQRVAPGVPPQQYQQVPHQQQYNQPPPPPQYQQVPVQQHQQQAQVQYQQVPVQQQQQQQQYGYQQPPAAHHPHAHGHGQPQQVLNAANIQHERQHIAEHLDVPIDTSKMTEQELQFHYFKMHDSDNNNKLDGCELIKSLIHWHETEDKDENKNNDDHHDEHKESKNQIYTDDKLIEIIDQVLSTMDKNFDGYVDYQEYKLSDQEK